MVSLQAIWDESFQEELLNYKYQIESGNELLGASATSIESTSSVRIKGLKKILKLQLKVLGDSKMEGAVPNTRHKLFEACRPTWKSVLDRFEGVIFNLDSPEIVQTEERRLALEVLIGGLLLNPAMGVLVDPRRMIEAICNTALCQENIFGTQSYKITEAIYAYVVAIKSRNDFVEDGAGSEFDMDRVCECFKNVEGLIGDPLQEQGNDSNVLKSILKCMSSTGPIG